MTLQQLLYFNEVAKTLHFTKAAQNLYITQSALSYAISALEKELNVPLFVRETSKNISLTNFGTALKPLAEKAIKDFEDIEMTMREMRNPLSGVVNVAYSYINGHRFIPQMFSSLSSLEQFSEINFNFDINHYRKHFEPEVATGEFDICFSCRKQTEGLVSVPFAKQQLYVMCSKNHHFAKQDCVTVHELSDEFLIGYDQGRNLDNWMHEMFRRNGLKLDMDLYAHDWVEQLSQVALGKYVALLPMLPFDDELISAVPLKDEMAVRDIYMMWAENKKLSYVVKYVRDCCLNFYDSPPIV